MSFLKAAGALALSLLTMFAASPAAAQAEHSVIELRQYTLYPGQRDTLIALFDREFVESQEALGMRIVGQFRDLDRPDMYVWLRSFADMPARAQGLNGFYFGPVWQAHRNEANATLADSDNVLLLKPLWPGSGFKPDRTPRRPPGVNGAGQGLIVLKIQYLNAETEGARLSALARELTPVLAKAGGSVEAWLTTEPSPNNFPRLPIRQGERVLVSVMRFADQAAYDAYRARLGKSPAFKALAAEAEAISARPAEVLRLQPTARSRLHG